MQASEAQKKTPEMVESQDRDRDAGPTKRSSKKSGKSTRRESSPKPGTSKSTKGKQM